MVANSSAVSPLFSYGLAAGLVVLALLLSLRLAPFLGQDAFSLFFAAVAVSAWYGGFGPGLAATALAGGLSAYFLLPPDYSLAPPRG